MDHLSAAANGTTGDWTTPLAIVQFSLNMISSWLVTVWVLVNPHYFLGWNIITNGMTLAIETHHSCPLGLVAKYPAYASQWDFIRCNNVWCCWRELRKEPTGSFYHLFFITNSQYCCLLNVDFLSRLSQSFHSLAYLLCLDFCFVSCFLGCLVNGWVKRCLNCINSL